MAAGIVRSWKTTPGEIINSEITIYDLITPDNYAEAITVRQFNLTKSADSKAGATLHLSDPTHDLYIYVLEGSALAQVDNAQKITLNEASAIFLLPQEKLEITTDTSIQIIAMYLPSPSTPWAKALEKPTNSVDRIISTQLGAASAQAATGDRQFEVLFDAKSGSRGATLFVGFIPSSGAPQHYHLYDEVCVIVRGKGALVTSESSGDEISQPLEKGSSFYVAPRFLHAIHNPGPDDLWILGLFRPEGSAAAAFYPDGRPAPVDPDR